MAKETNTQRTYLLSSRRGIRRRRPNHEMHRYVAPPPPYIYISVMIGVSTVQGFETTPRIGNLAILSPFSPIPREMALRVGHVLVLVFAAIRKMALPTNQRRGLRHVAFFSECDLYKHRIRYNFAWTYRN